MAGDGDMVVVGRIAGVFGVRGEVKVHSLTDPPDNLCEYRPWFLAATRGDAGLAGDVWQECSPQSMKPHGRGFVASFAGIADRDQATASLVGRDIAVPRCDLPVAGADEFYWVDLVGLSVVTTGGQTLGVVDHLLETGANDVLVVKGDRERLIPYLPDRVVIAVRPQEGLIEVDWDPEF